MTKPTSNSEIIKARTPLYLVGAGTLIATFAILAVSVSGNNKDLKDLTHAAFSLAGTAIAGGAGLAQSNGKQEQNQPSFENNGFQVVEQNNDGFSNKAIEPAQKNGNLSKN